MKIILNLILDFVVYLYCLLLVKDMNQSLVDDFLVYSDKIGSANFFWSFPSKRTVDIQNERDRMKAGIETFELLLQRASETVETAKIERCADGREGAMYKLAALREEESRLDRLIEAGRENDPAEIERIKMEANKCKLAADRWTDNVFCLKKYAVKKLNVQGKEANRYLGIKDDFDYPVYLPSNKKQK